MPPRKTQTEGPSPASAWGDEPLQKEHTLPSGNVMVLRRGPSMRRLVMQGVVPNTMLGIEWTFPDPGDGKQAQPVIAINSVEFEKQRAAVVCAMAVDPGVVLEPLEGAVLYDLLEENDIAYIVTWAQEGLKGIARFLGEFSSVDDGASGEGVGEDAE